MDDELRTHLEGLHFDPPRWAKIFWQVTSSEKDGVLHVRASPLPGEDVPPAGDPRWAQALAHLHEECTTFGHAIDADGVKVFTDPPAHLKCEVELKAAPAGA